MAQGRGQTYKDYAWTPALGKLYERNSLVLALALSAGLALLLALAVAMGGGLWNSSVTGDFFKVFPHTILVGLFAPIFMLAIPALGMGVRSEVRRVGQECVGPG